MSMSRSAKRELCALAVTVVMFLILRFWTRLRLGD